MIRSLPLANGLSIGIAFQRINSVGVLNTWQRDIQHCIAALGRPDSGWNWRNISRMAAVIGIRQSPSIFALMVSGATTAYPSALVCLLEDTVYPMDPDFGAVYVYYMSAAPEACLTAIARRDEIPKLGGQALIDLAIQRSLARGHDGRVWLHAAPAGGQGLFDWYRNACGMQLVPGNVTLPGMRRFATGNDGRYFYHDDRSAQHALARLSQYR